ncbi:TPA: hypothetical protein VB881_000727 [Streptococcus suis]|uniref:Membrane protein n=1 Tax=Streptococcus suis TaxID=1307 RepID=A0A116NRG7_STRSU|nr:hypothetical protein [Streptococcus suis]HEM3194302.1 hypothetical protein [Streptococcus suis 10581]MBY4967196.1 hypothetical protein [Streptococcus suis]NQF82634.1 hypothetical protein [Streptococcus suis]NQM02660.1 hypothetical protein [Streptococcus suis]NQM41491.1 hypothetical protein [Streptococcus suis]
MKKLPTYIGVIIFVVTLLINWLLPSLAKVLNTFFIWTIIACLCYTIYYWISYWLYVRKQKK